MALVILLPSFAIGHSALVVILICVLAACFLAIICLGIGTTMIRTLYPEVSDDPVAGGVFLLSRIFLGRRWTEHRRFGDR
jgi:hypothetical protein